MEGPLITAALLLRLSSWPYLRVGSSRKVSGVGHGYSIEQTLAGTIPGFGALLRTLQVVSWLVLQDLMQCGCLGSQIGNEALLGWPWLPRRWSGLSG